MLVLQRKRSCHHHLPSPTASPSGEYYSTSTANSSTSSNVCINLNQIRLYFSACPYRLGFSEELHLPPNSPGIKCLEEMLLPGLQNSHHSRKATGPWSHQALFSHTDALHWMPAHRGDHIHGAGRIHHRYHPGMPVDVTTPSQYQLEHLGNTTVE